jgi:hypothetical protein
LLLEWLLSEPGRLGRELLSKASRLRSEWAGLLAWLLASHSIEATILRLLATRPLAVAA